NPMGWSTIIIRVDNWTGTYAPMCLSFNRNSESRAAARDFSYPAGAGNSGAANRPLRKQLWMADYREPALYDGYANTLFKLSVPMSDRDYMFENNVDWRFMSMDLCGDARTELVGYDDSGRIRIYYNNSHGDVTVYEDGSLNEAERIAALRSGITGVPKQQTYFMSNYTRYPTDIYFGNIEKRTPAQPQFEDVKATSVFIDWTPIITADSYSLFKDGVEVYFGAEIGYLDEDVLPGIAYEYHIVAYQGEGNSPASLPNVLVINVDKADLAALIEEAGEFDENEYTNETWDPFAAALANALEVIGNEDATQEDIDAAWVDLYLTMNALEKSVIVRVALNAWVDKKNGNKNDLYITVTEYYCNGKKVVATTEMFVIDNNAAGTYNVAGYKVYCDTKGNTQIRDLYIVG
ncbi:MAG: hypothetical protein FWE49_04340, partial [Synergistaceae bacterium]|nr:hypothetical protein [Synergistaceae bacterium]